MDTTETPYVMAAAGPPAALRRPWPIAIAILALAVAMFGLASLSGVGSTLMTAAPGNPLEAELYKQVAAQSATESEVMIMDHAYSPATLTISVGDTVTWTNHDEAPHDVTVTDGPEKFESPMLEQGESFSYTFTKAGEYSYYCTIHPHMTASVTVEGGEEPPPSEEPPSEEPPSEEPPSEEPPSEEPPSEEPPSDPGACTSEAMADAFLAHVRGGHLSQTPSQQVADLLTFDNWVQTHTVWISNVLTPALEGDATGKEMIKRFWAHVDGGHLQLTPSQQVADILELDHWIQTHTVWISSVLEPALADITC